MKNIIINIAAIYLFIELIGWLAQFFPILGMYLDAPYYEQAFLAFWFTLVFFIVIMALQVRYKLTTDNISGWKKAVAYLFALDDVYFNVTFSPFLLFQYANSYGEGWMFTSHCRAIKNYSEQKLISGDILTPVEISRYWLCEKVYGPIMNLVQKGHYS